MSPSRWRFRRKSWRERVMAAIDDLKAAQERNGALVEQILTKLSQAPAGGSSDADVEAVTAALNADSDKMQAVLTPPV